MILRKAEEEDIKDILEVYLKGYRGLEEYSYTHPDDVQAYLKWLFRRDSEGILVAEEGGKIVGFVASDSGWFSKREGKVVGAIHELVVLPEHGNKGIGRALVEKTLEYFKSKGLDTAELWVGEENIPAYNFYKSLGFRERDKFNYWVRMTKSLK